MLRRLLIALSIASAGCIHSMSPAARALSVQTLNVHVQPLVGADRDYDALMQLIGENRFVLLGESTHGTEEFYRERARITRRLIQEKGFTVVAVESDWADSFDVNEYVQGRGTEAPGTALQTFERFPTWTWNNAAVRDLVAWLRDWDSGHPDRRVGFYGLDLYNIPESARRVVEFLQQVNPDMARVARDRYDCFGRIDVADLPEYGARVVRGERGSCAEGAAAEFLDIARLLSASGEEHRPGDEALISAWQNARVVMDGEAYFRLINVPGVESWNLRDKHMADTIDMLARHLGPGRTLSAKVVVWAHSSHLGDARTTERAAAGEMNVGQLIRQRHDGDSVLVGLTTYDGAVRAASDWGGRSNVFSLKPARRDSFAGLFHDASPAPFFLDLRDDEAARQALGGSHLERFIGVVYSPTSERLSHYYRMDMARQFDAVIHIDHSSALKLNAYPGP